MIRVLSAALLTAGLSGAAAQTQQTKPAASRMQPIKPKAPSAAATSCAQYGAGFVRLPDSDTCVRIGGSVDVSVGGNSAMRR